jgi:hypothetical protein
VSIWRTLGVGVHIRPASWFDGRNGVDGEDEYGGRKGSVGGLTRIGAGESAYMYVEYIRVN